MSVPLVCVVCRLSNAGKERGRGVQPLLSCAVYEGAGRRVALRACGWGHGDTGQENADSLADDRYFKFSNSNKSR
jgi:hypothetical protein